MALRKLVAGNWKMNGDSAALSELEAIAAAARTSDAKLDVLVCPPATLIDRARQAQPDLAIGGQDCHPNAKGAHTGDVSAAMLVDAGASFVIVGHSERRADHGETDETVCGKAKAALSVGLTAIVCVGETEAERDGGQALAVVKRQLEGSVPEDGLRDSLVIAYEPVWAIGTGRTPSTRDVAEMHAAIRKKLGTLLGREGDFIRILYGGSVKPENAAELMAVANVDGALVGGASLTAAQLVPIIEAAAKA